jgi:hypothetical protein
LCNFLLLLAPTSLSIASPELNRMHHKYDPVEVDEGSETERTSLSNDVSEGDCMIYNQPRLTRKRERNVALILHTILLFLNLLLVMGAFIFLKRHVSSPTYSKFEYGKYTRSRNVKN